MVVDVESVRREDKAGFRYPGHVSLNRLNSQGVPFGDLGGRVEEFYWSWFLEQNLRHKP